MLQLIITIILIIIIVLILHDIYRILELEEELLREQYIMRGEINVLMNLQSRQFVPDFYENEKDQTTTVEVTP